MYDRGRDSCTNITLWLTEHHTSWRITYRSPVCEMVDPSGVKAVRGAASNGSERSWLTPISARVAETRQTPEVEIPPNQPLENSGGTRHCGRRR